MTNRPSWRKIEAALTDIARSYGWLVEEQYHKHQRTGDRLAVHPNGQEIANITDLARELEQKL